MSKSECPKCYGMGKVPVGEKNVDGTMQTRYGPCGRCDGDGEVPSEEVNRGNPRPPGAR